MQPVPAVLRMRLAAIALLLLCLAVERSSTHPWLLFANRKDIRLVDASTAKRNSNVTVVIKDLEDAAALDYHYNKGMVCWTDISLEMIRCAQHQGASLVKTTNVITTGLLHFIFIGATSLSPVIPFKDTDVSTKKSTAFSLFLHGFS